MARGLNDRIHNTLTHTYHFAKDASQTLYCYQEGVYLPNGEEIVQRAIPALLKGWNEEWVSSIPSEAIKYITQTAPWLPEIPPHNLINLQNGLLNTQTLKLTSHNPKDLLNIQLPVEYNPNANCPGWEQCVVDWFPPDSHHLAWELIAWIIQPWIPIQKAIVLYGEGSNGKSLFLNALSQFLSPSNVANKSLFDLETNRFSASFLLGKLANICADLPNGRLTDTGIFKAIVGGDSITGEIKYKPAFNLKLFTRLIFSANHLPRSTDSSDAFFRRWLVIPFEKTFEDNPRTKLKLESILYSPTELSGVLNKALAVASKVADYGFDEPETSKIAKEEYRDVADTLTSWLNHHLVTREGVYLIKPQLHQQYEKDSAQDISPKAFTQKVLNVFPNITESVRKVEGKTYRVWEGLTWRGNL